MIQCTLCNKQINRSPSKLKKSKSKLYFCSRDCKDKAQRLGGINQIQPSHYGTSKKSYRSLAFTSLVNCCNRCEYSKCRGALEVHHIDRDRNNNMLDNLEILCRNCHAEEHYLK